MLPIKHFPIDKILLIFFAFYTVSCNILAKNQSGDSFMTGNQFTLPQREFAKQLNGLQVVAKPLFGEPFSLINTFDKSSKSALKTSNDDAKILLAVFPESTLLKNNLLDIHNSDLLSGHSLKKSWSYHPMPTYKGGVAYRYLDPLFLKAEKWPEFFLEYQKNSPEKIISNHQSEILSPIEKYEYLIGNTNFSMTKLQWQAGQTYNQNFGNVPSWIGICHGTAPASFSHPRPEKTIKLKSFDLKEDIIFYPSDIKVLLSYAWSISGGPSAMIGSRCGIVIQPGTRPGLSCLDTNPASFHLTAINLLGINGQTFIIDSYAGNQVWNQSISSYSFDYYRPGTRNLTTKIEHALISKKDYTDDPYASYRSPETVNIIGIKMDIVHIAGTKLSSREEDSVDQDSYNTTTYWYDLEIDAAGNIIGGEWHDIAHPDFIWVVANNFVPKTIYDYIIENSLISYNGKMPLSLIVTAQAKTAAEKGFILYTILEAMLRLSQNPDYITQPEYGSASITPLP